MFYGFGIRVRGGWVQFRGGCAKGLGCRKNAPDERCASVQGLGSRVWGVGIQGIGSRVWSFGFRF